MSSPLAAFSESLTTHPSKLGWLGCPSCAPSVFPVELCVCPSGLLTTPSLGTWAVPGVASTEILQQSLLFLTGPRAAFAPHPELPTVCSGSQQGSQSSHRCGEAEGEAQLSRGGTQ